MFSFKKLFQRIPVNPTILCYWIENQQKIHVERCFPFYSLNENNHYEEIVVIDFLESYWYDFQKIENMIKNVYISFFSTDDNVLILKKGEELPPYKIIPYDISKEHWIS